MTSETNLGLVLSGGGARGAYEVGVLLHLADAHPAVLERVRVVTGSSVGAVNAAYLVSRGLTPDSVTSLAQLWRGLKVDRLLSLSGLDTLRMLGAAPLRLLLRRARSPAAGLLDDSALWEMVQEQIDWDRLHREVDGGRIDVLAMAATDIASGRTHLFYESAPNAPAHRPFTELEAIPVGMTLSHVRASAAIPLLMCPVKVQQRWYMDGSVRHNTPLSPALHFGATSLVIVNVRGTNRPEQTQPEFPGIGQVVGKLLDSIFLDRVAFDLDRLERINDVLKVAEQLAGADFRERLQALGRPAYHQVRYASITPTEDISSIAAEHVASSENLPRFSFLHLLSALFESDAHSTGDAASFLLFDGPYAAALIELGRQDAARQTDRFATL